MVDILAFSWYHHGDMYSLNRSRMVVLSLVLFTCSAISVSYAAVEDGYPAAYRALPNVPAPPVINYAHSAALLDVTTGTVLYQKEGSQLWPPASLTKLITIFTALDAAESGDFSLHEVQPVHPNAYHTSVPRGSSLMYLGPGQEVDGIDLLRGLAISSGNDAAVEVAMRTSGSVSVFCGQMNRVVHRLGFRQFYFEDPAGLSPANRVSAVGMARFSAALLQRWPWLTDELFSLREFTYPQPRHYPNGLQGGAIRQPNRNGLIYSYEGADGLKTGYIEESGYNLAATAERDGRRLIAVILGVQADSHHEGGRWREADAERLLDWGFREFRVVELTVPEVDPVTVWGGSAAEMNPNRLVHLRSPSRRTSSREYGGRSIRRTTCGPL